MPSYIRIEHCERKSLVLFIASLPTPEIMTRKELRKAAEQMVQAGMGRQQVFNELRVQSGLPEEKVAQVVRYVPSLESRERYMTAQAMLIGLLVLTIVIKLGIALLQVIQVGLAWTPFIFLLPLINIALLYGVVTYRGRAYHFVGLFAFFTLTRIVFDLNSSTSWFVWVDVAIAAALLGLGYFLNSKMVPGYQEVKEKYVNAEGQERLRNVIQFPDQCVISPRKDQ